MKKLLCSLLSIIILLTISCEIGLGASVDTEPPALTITSPNNTSVIRDDFAISGTYSDDGSLAGVSVTLKRADKKGSSYSFSGSLTEDPKNRGSGTYNIEIPAKSQNILDGVYTAEVVVKDSLGRKTVSSATYTIDNNPPILILQRPSTDASVNNISDVDVFGKLFTLSGLAADDNNIDHIDISIYENYDAETGELKDFIKTIQPSKKNLPSNVSLDIAAWGDDEGNLYKSIYGENEEDGDKQFYFKVEIYDSAKRYPPDGSEQSEEDELGNHTDEYYLYNEFSASTIANEKVNDLYSILNGTSGRSATNEVIDELNRIKRKAGTFVLNPKNNPVYNLAGFDSGALDVFDNTTITIEVKAGLDGTPLMKNTLKLYLLPLNTQNQISGSKIFPAAEDVTITGASSYKINYKINRKNPNNSAAYGYGSYLIGVEGKDTKNVELIPENSTGFIKGYPIKINVSGDAPELTTSYLLNGQPANQSIIYMPKYKPDVTPDTESEILISGTVKSAHDEKPTLYILIDGENKNGDIALTASGDKWVFSNVSVKFGTDLESGQHTIVVVANNGAETSDKKTIMFDADGPVIDIRNITPIAHKYNTNGTTDDKSYINGNIDISVSFADEFDVVDIDSERKPKIEFVQTNSANNEVKTTIADDIASLSYKAENISTLSLEDNKKVKIRVTAYDRAGNINIKEEEYTVDQSTDLPVVLADINSNINLSNTWEQISAKEIGRKNVFNLGGQLLLKFIDDDGLAEYSVYSLKTSDGIGNKPDSPTATGTISGNENQFSWTLPSDAGYYKVWLDVSDKTGKTKELSPFYIQVASGMPIVTLENDKFVTNLADSSMLASDAIKAPLKVNVKIESTEGPFVVKRADITSSNPDPAVSSAVNIRNESGNVISSVDSTYEGISEVIDYYAIPIGKADGEYKIKYFVIDSNNNAGVKTVTYKLDSTAPTVNNIKIWQGGAYTVINEYESNWYNSDTMLIRVEATDGTNVSHSDIASVEYTLTPDDDFSWTAFSKKTDSYERTVSFENGENTLYIRVKDNVGNIRSVSKTIKVDIDAPEFEVVADSFGSLDDSNNIIYINDENKNSSLVIYGRYSDEQSGVKELEVSLGKEENSPKATVKYYGSKQDNEDIKSLAYKTYNQFASKNTIEYWRAEFTKAQLESVFTTAENGTPKTSILLNFVGKNTCDNAILSAHIPNITIVKDIGLPVLDNINVNSQTTKGLYKATDTEYYVRPSDDNSFAITGIANDSVSGVSKVTCTIGDEIQESESTGWSFNIPLDAATSSTIKNIKLNVYDKAGNKSADYDYTVKVDMEEPKSTHLIDALQKDLYFRIGDYENDAGDKVGGKYSNGTYGNSSTIKIRGLFDDTNEDSSINCSGIYKYYYVVFHDKEVVIDASKNYSNGNGNPDKPYVDGVNSESGKIFFKSPETLKQYVVDNTIETFYPIAVETSAVEKNNSDGTKTTVSVNNNYKQVVNGFQEGKNFLVLVAEDNVGNIGIDYAEVGEPGSEVKYYCYSLNVDSVAPIFEPKTAGDFSKVTITNGSASKTLDFYVIDEDSGIEAKNVSLKIGSNEVIVGNGENDSAITVNETEVSGKYHVTVKFGKNDLQNVDGYSTVITTVSDKAGNNSSPQQVGILNKDSDPPVLSFTSPEENAEVNKIITVTGKATDANTIVGINLTAVCGDTTKEYVFEKDGTSNSINYANSIWSVEINTAELDSTFSAAGKDVTLSVTATDDAGNNSSAVSSVLKINQNADRPIITIGSNVDFSQHNGDEVWVKGSSTIYGSVIDDDGIASTDGFKIYRKAVGVAGADFENAAASYSGGSWNVKLPNDGAYILKFEVTDKAGTTFTSADLATDCSDSEILATPIIQDAADVIHQIGVSKTDSPGTLVPICLDTAAPALVIQAISRDKATWIEDYNRSDFYLGGEKNIFYVKVSASDTSGLADTDAIKATFSGSMKVGTDDYELQCPSNACTVEAVEGSENEFIIGVSNFSVAKKNGGTGTTGFSGTLNLKITANDKAGLETEKTLSRTIDNTVPHIKISAPNSVSSTAVVSGSIEGETVNPEVWFMLTKNETQPAADSVYWKQDTFASLSYNIYFDGIDSETATHTDLFKTYLLNEPLNLVTQAQIDNKTASLQTVYVWIKAIDVCGNTSYEHAMVKVDPLGNIPTVTVTYPASDNVKLGGTITLMGMATDNVEAKYVWIKLDTNGDGVWNLTDYNKLKTATNSGYTFGVINSNKTLAEANVTPSASNISNIAIRVPVSGGSWNQNTNADNELIPAGATSNTVTMWVTATDDDSGNGTGINKSVEVTRAFIADNDNPYFVQSSLKVTKTGDYEQVYKEGMSVKGEWWLEGTVVDDGSGIKKISLKNLTDSSASDITYIDISEGKLEQTTGDFQFRQNTTSGQTNYDFRIKVGETTGVGEKSFRITAYENNTNNLSTYKEFKVTYDNVKPTIAEQTDTDNFKISNTVVNSQGYYALRSVAYEKETGDTGVERVAVFFTRTVGTTTYVFDPMFKRTVASSKLETGSAIVQDSGTDGDMLYWGSVTASSISSKTLNISGSIPSYVHVGGLAKVNGVVYRIDGVSSNTVTLSDAPGDKDSNTTVKFAVANVVDNSNPEAKDNEKDTNNSAYNSTTGFGYGYCNGYVYDDGDKIMENLHKDDSTSWTWELYVNSKNIPDGDVDIHYVVFDKAGNSHHDVVTNASVENNKPRLVSVQLGLDKNQNGAISDDEQTLYYPDGFTTKPIRYTDAVETIDISGITVKSMMTVTPEIVGGNGDLYYQWKTKKTTAWQKVQGAGNQLMSGNDEYDDADFNNANDYVTNDVLVTQTGIIEHDIGWLITNSTDNDTNFNINYEIYDSTEGKTVFTDTNKVSINITGINLQVRDKVAPTVVIDDFYWNSLTDNSVYTSKTAAQIKSVADLEGHIELHGDLPTDKFNATAGAADAEFDADDKVSGKIKLKGTVSDNIVLTDLYLLIDGMTGLSTSTKVATYDKTNGKWKNAAGTADFAKVGVLGTNGYEFDIDTDSNEFDIDNGHSVNWTLVWDTATISNVAQNNIKVQVVAYDNASAAGNNSNRSTTATRQVDVVPYITKIDTGLNGAYSSKPSVFNRSANGAYSVRRGEPITIWGYNLKKGTTAPTVTIPVTSATTITPTASSKTSITVAIPNTAKSGEIGVTVNAVQTLNNKTAKSITTGEGDEAVTRIIEYNQEPNGINNDILTDVRKLSVWSFNDVVTNNTGVRYPTMRVGKDTNQTVGFVYDSGAKYTMAYKDGTNYTLGNSWTLWYDTAVAVDSEGRLYGSSMNGDSGGTGTKDMQRQNGVGGWANYHFYSWINSNVNTFAYTDGTYTAALENSTTTYRSDNGYNANRIQNPKITTSATDSLGKIYTVYYDSSNEQVRFRYGQYSSSGFDTDYGVKSHSNGNGGSATGYQVIAGPESMGVNKIDGEDDEQEGSANTSRAGEYAAVGVIPSTVATGNGTAGTAVVAWYDASSQRLLFSYNTAPTSTANAANWGTNTKIIDSDFAGWYVDMVVDPDGGIHIAYYGASNGDLKYAYLPNYSSAPQICTVDSYLSVGTNISIEVPTAKETVYKADGSTTTRYVPRISYFMSAFTKTKYSVRTAYLYKLGEGDVIADGVSEDKFTGNWEVMTVPTDQIPLDYSVGVGIKKNESNVNSTLLGYGTKTGLQTAALQ